MSLIPDLSAIRENAAEVDGVVTLSTSAEPDYGRSLDEHKKDYIIEHERKTLAQLYELKQQELAQHKEIHKWRKNYSSKIFWLVCVWLGCVIVSIFFQGFNFSSFSLTDGVLIAFITTTTASVVGIFLVVANWLFPHNKSTKETSTTIEEKSSIEKSGD